jgi:hypothetical protein
LRHWASLRARPLRALSRPAGRRLLAADAAADAPVAAFTTHLLPVARAAKVTHEDSTVAVPLKYADGTPVGTTVTQYEDTVWSGGEPELVVVTDYTTETVETRAGDSATTTRRVTLKALMSRCPDASGVAHGTLDLTERETTTVGGIVVKETSTFASTIAAKFADNARIASVQVNGNWSFTQGQSSSVRSVSGTATTGRFHQNTRGANGSIIDNYVELKTAVTTATDDGIAASGGYLGPWVTMTVEDVLTTTLLDPLQVRALGGACVQVVPNADTVHVIPGGSVAIVAHLTDSGGLTQFAGPITVYNGWAGSRRPPHRPT